MTIKENDFRGVDLNLMVTFLVLVRERNVTRAAEKLHVGQPAVSGALARLRELFADDLLIRTANGMMPTVKALALETAIRPAVEGIRTALFEPRAFDPANAERTFTLGLTDWVEVWLMPRLFARLQELAPKVRIAVKATDPFQARAMLERKEMDLGIGPFTPGPAWQKIRPLKTTGFSCVYSRAQIPTADEISLAQYTSHTHLLVTYRSAVQSFIDEKLAQQGLQRQVGYTTTHFSTLPSLLRQSPVIATVPGVLAEHWKEHLGLHVSPVPLDTPAFSVSMIWHATHDADPALMWLLSLIEEAAG